MSAHQLTATIPGADECVWVCLYLLTKRFHDEVKHQSISLVLKSTHVWSDEVKATTGCKGERILSRQDAAHIDNPSHQSVRQIKNCVHLKSNYPPYRQALTCVNDAWNGTAVFFSSLSPSRGWRIVIVEKAECCDAYQPLDGDRDLWVLFLLRFSFFFYDKSPQSSDVMKRDRGTAGVSLGLIYNLHLESLK